MKDATNFEFKDIGEASLAFAFNLPEELTKIPISPDLLGINIDALDHVRDSKVYDNLSAVKEALFRNIYEQIKKYSKSVEKQPFGYGFSVVIKAVYEEG